MQAAVAADDLETRAQPQVKGVAEQDLRAARGHLVGRDALHRAVRPDRHEGGRVDPAVRELEHPAPGAAIAMRNGELQSWLIFLSAWRRRTRRSDSAARWRA